MSNKFSRNREKKIPKDLASCYETDNLTHNLWVWYARIEAWGRMLFWILLIIGIFDTIRIATELSELHELIGDATIEEMRFHALQTGTKIPTIWESIVDRLLAWLGYAALEYLAYHAVALLIGALASIEQHTKISANIALYTRAQSEGYTDNIDPKSNTWRCEKCDLTNSRYELYCKNCGHHR